MTDTSSKGQFNRGGSNGGGTGRGKSQTQSMEPLRTLGDLYSRETKFVPGKIQFTLSLYLFPLLKGHFYSGEIDTFWGSRNQRLTSS